MESEVDAGFEDVSQQAGSTAQPTSAPEAGAPAVTPEPGFELDGKTLTREEAQERLQTSDTAYRKLQSERDSAIHQAEQGRQAVDAWEWVYNEKPELYKQIVGARAEPTAPATAPPDIPSAAPQGAGESNVVYGERLARLEQMAQAQEQRHWDAWADSEEAKAAGYYKSVTGNDMPQAWKGQLLNERTRTRSLDLVSLTRSLLFDDVQAGRVSLNRETVQTTQANATRGATQGAEGVVAPIDDVSTMTDEEVYMRGKAGLNMPQNDTRWVGNR